MSTLHHEEILEDCLIEAEENFRVHNKITLNPKIRQYDVKNKVYPKGRSTLGMPGTRVTKKRDKKWKHAR